MCSSWRKCAERSCVFLGWNRFLENNRETAVNATASKSLVEIAYDSELTRQCGRVLVDALADHLGGVQAGDGLVQRWRDPEQNISDAAGWLEAAEFSGPEGVVDQFKELLELSLQRGQNLNHPRCVGHQVPAPLPLVGLFDAVTTMTNQVQGVYEMGPWGIAAERAVIERIGKQIGYTAGEFGGLVTSGGSLGNLTALLAARNEACPWIWGQGNQPHAIAANAANGEHVANVEHVANGANARMPVLVVHSDAHYCVDRAAGVMGIGKENVLRVPLDEQRRMDVAALDAMLARLRAGGVPIIAVVAVACTTAVGAFDPIESIADVCSLHEVWLHVDAAHGGAACLSQQHRQLVQGLERADSVVFDAHKMMFVPAVCALVFYRNKQNRFRAFEQTAPYLFDPSAPDMSEYDNGMVTFECTKRSAALGLWGAMSMFGMELFEQLVDRVFQVAQQLYDLLDEASEFEVIGQPQANIVVFRFLPQMLRQASTQSADSGSLKLSQLQLRIRRNMLESGFAYVTQTSLNGQVYLRCTIMNPLTDELELSKIVTEITRVGPTLWSELQEPDPGSV